MANEASAVNFQLSGPVLDKWRYYSNLIGETSMKRSLEHALDHAIWVRQHAPLQGQVQVVDAKGTVKGSRSV